MASRPLDHSFISAMRERIEVASTIDKLQAHIADKDKHPMSMSQLKASEILLRKALPDLKAIEHSGEIARPLSRGEILERLAQLHAATTQRDVDAGTAGAAEPALPAATHH